MHSIRFPGAAYTGADLPNSVYGYSSATISVRAAGKIATVLLFGTSKSRPLAVNSYDGGKWYGWDQYVTKDDLGVFLTASGKKAAVYNSKVELTSLKLYAGHTYLVLGKTGVDAGDVALISASMTVPGSAYGSAFSFGEARTIGTSGGGCMTALIASLTKDYTITLYGHGYTNKEYNYEGSLIAIRLK